MKLLYCRYVFHKDAESYGFGDECGEWHNVNLNVPVRELGWVLSRAIEPCDNGRTSLEFRWIEPEDADIQNRMHKKAQQ